jgi:hypothetical protein
MQLNKKKEKETDIFFLVLYTYIKYTETSSLKIYIKAASFSCHTKRSEVMKPKRFNSKKPQTKTKNK